MKNRRAFLLTLTSGFVALAVLVGPVLADELIGYIAKVDIEGKKLTVTTDDNKEVIVTVTDDTEVVTKKGSSKLDLEKLAKGVEKAKEKEPKGYRAKITHENGKASKIQKAKKAAPVQE